MSKASIETDIRDYGLSYQQAEHDKEIRNKAIDDAKETVAKAICVGCGYLDGYKCNYKGANCGVSKPMLESVVKALEQMKGGGEC